MNKTEPHTRPDDLIAAYLNKELAPMQQIELEKWVSADIANKQYFYEMTEVWLASTAELGKSDKSRLAYQHFRARLDGQKKSQKISLRFIKLTAAILSGVLLLGSGYYYGNRHSENPSLYAVQTIEVPMGSRSRVTLPDGTVAWLNAGSKLRYASGFSHRTRNIQLEGEGYFEVTHNEKLPFIVNTSDIDIQVLGTKFSVKAYTNEKDIEVILTEGSINFINKNDPQASLILTPEQQAVYNKKSGQTNVIKVPASQATSWTTGAHFFNESTLEQITNQLEKSFDVTFIYKEEKKKQLTFYGDFRSEDTLDDILTIISSSGKFTYKRTHNTIEIY